MLQVPPGPGKAAGADLVIRYYSELSIKIPQETLHVSFIKIIIILLSDIFRGHCKFCWQDLCCTDVQVPKEREYVVPFLSAGSAKGHPKGRMLGMGNSVLGHGVPWLALTQVLQNCTANSQQPFVS